MDQENILKILDRNDGDKDGLIPTLEEIQDEYGYLPEEALKIISSTTGRSLIDLYSVATFYKTFSLTPVGKNVINVCLGTACHVRGAPLILEELERKLKIKPNETTEDRMFSLRTVNCLGACALGPIVVINKDYHGNMNIQKAGEILEDYGYTPEVETDETLSDKGK